MPRTRGGTCTRSVTSPPRITFAESVTSYVDAHELAARDQRPLRIAEQAWQQMLDAGVAPQTNPTTSPSSRPATAIPNTESAARSGQQAAPDERHQRHRLDLHDR
jgi:hypothetical protein